MNIIFGSVAWNQRKCSFRNSRVTTLGPRLRKFCRLICTSNRDQSGSQCRAAGLPAGGGGGASPLLSATSDSNLWQSEVAIRTPSSTRG
eukprot:9485742-Pyramimonas_sp.AAC.1